MYDFFSAKPWRTAILLSFLLSFLNSVGSKVFALSADQSPTINSYSKNNFSVYLGDTISIVVDADGNDLKYNWSNSSQIYCDQKHCLIDSTRLGLGTHSLLLKVYNTQGSKSLKYKIKIIRAKPSRKSRKVSPSIISELKEVRSFDAEDPYIIAQKGLGYRFDAEGATVVDKSKKIELSWNEKIKSESKSILKFGIAKREEHFLSDGAEVLLADEVGQARAILLKKGFIRCRSLFETTPTWVVSVGEWSQISSGTKSDYIVELLTPQSFRLTVLRGEVSVEGAGLFTQKDKGEILLLPQGVATIITQKQSALSSVVVPKSEKISEIILATTPQFSQSPIGLGTEGSEKDEKNKEVSLNSFSLVGEKVTSEADTSNIKRAEEALIHHDYPEALALLLSTPKPKSDLFSYYLALARASRGFFLDQEAAEYFELAIDQEQARPEAYFEKAEMLLAAEKWEKSLLYLGLAEERLFHDVAKLKYYRGIAEYQLGHSYVAQQQLTYSLWSRNDLLFSESAKAYLKRIKDEKGYEYHISSGYYYDSNILRLSDSEALPKNYQDKSAHGVAINFMLSYFIFDTDHGAWDFSYDLDLIRYSDILWRDLELTKQTFASDFSYSFGGSSTETSFFGFKIKPFFEMISQGEVRALDSVGADLSVKVFSIYSQPVIRYLSLVRIDPLPGSDDVLDVELWEVVPASDRSHRQQVLSLETTPWNEGSLSFDFLLNFSVISYRDYFVRGSENTTGGFEALLSYRRDQRSEASFLLGYFDRSFKESIDSREDQELYFDVSGSWKYTPNLTQSALLSYQSHSSSRDESDFSRLSLLLDLSLLF